MPEHRIKKGEVMPVSEELLNLRVGSETYNQEKSQIQADYKTADKPMKKKTANIGEDDSMRIRIIKASLFPSIYSK